jgi:hypothetical protein
MSVEEGILKFFGGFLMCLEFNSKRIRCVNLESWAFVSLFLEYDGAERWMEKVL